MRDLKKQKKTGKKIKKIKNTGKSTKTKIREKIWENKYGKNSTVKKPQEKIVRETKSTGKKVRETKVRLKK
jgi:hypothetical protein